jgi:hypothetical protein
MTGDVLQFRADLPYPAASGIAAEACPTHRLVTGGADVAVQGVDPIGQRPGANRKAERPTRGSHSVAGTVVDHDCHR